MKAKLVFTITNDDGSPFSANETTWDGLSREQANSLEGRGIEFLAGLNKWGAEVAKGKGSK